MLISESEASESSKSSGGVQEKTEVAPGVRILRAHGAARTGEVPSRRSGGHGTQYSLANAAGSRLLSPAQLHSQRRQTGKHTADVAGRRQTLRLRIRKAYE